MHKAASHEMKTAIRIVIAGAQSRTRTPTPTLARFRAYFIATGDFMMTLSIGDSFVKVQALDDGAQSQKHRNLETKASPHPPR